MQHTPHIGFPLTIGATLAVVWALSGAPILASSSSSASSNLLSSAREEKERESDCGPDLPSGVHHLHLLRQEGMKCPSPAYPWWK